MKFCTGCSKNKENFEFNKSKCEKDGLQRYCKGCNKNARIKNKEEISRKKKIYYKENRDTIIAYQDSYRKNHPETNHIYQKKNKDKIDKNRKIREKRDIEKIEQKRQKRKEYHLSKKSYHNEKSRNYSKNNRGKIAAKQRKRAATKLQRTPKWLTKLHFKEIEQFYIDAAELQWLGDPLCNWLEVDHIVPLQGKNVSGLHVPWNLQIISSKENKRKKNRF